MEPERRWHAKEVNSERFKLVALLEHFQKAFVVHIPIQNLTR